MHETALFRDSQSGEWFPQEQAVGKRGAKVTMFFLVRGKRVKISEELVRNGQCATFSAQ
ncbi:hypothetical protein GCM10009621_18040 [Corynebacterium felinum]